MEREQIAGDATTNKPGRTGMVMSLKLRRERLEKQLTELNRALNVLEANPELAEALDAIDSLNRLL